MGARRLDPSELIPSTALAARVESLAAMPRVHFEHDGDRIEALEGVPLALSLLAADRVVLSRSPKLHRPRGALCLRGHCEGCLLRVNDQPNVMACRVRAAGGEQVRSQNAFPSASLDVFGVADWFFPKGMDHHHLLVGAGRALNESMQYIARKMSGLGTLPEGVARFEPARRRTVDVLVVGAGESGVAAANSLGRAGFDVLLADLSPSHGGAALDVPDDDPGALAPDPSVSAAFGTAVVACFDDCTLLEDARGAIEVRSAARIFANGTHHAAGVFPGNDLPGVFTARALCRALRHGVLPGERLVLCGDGPWTRRALRALEWVRGAHVERCEQVLDAGGRRRVERATVSQRGAPRTLRCDAIGVEGTAAASYELAGQAGASLRWSDARGCFEPVAEADGATHARGVYVCGSLRLGDVDPEQRRADGEGAAARVARDLRGGATR